MGDRTDKARPGVPASKSDQVVPRPPTRSGETVVSDDVLQLGQGRRPAGVALSPLQTGNDDPKPLSKRINSMPEPADPSSPASPTRSLPPGRGRKSVQLPAKKTLRASEEFDRRYNGPYARPSLTMTRRSMSEARGRTPSRPTTAGERAPVDVEKGESRREGESAEPESRPDFMPEPPPLNYTLRTRIWSIVFFWTLILIDSVAMPIGLYFGLWYGVGPGTNTPTEKKEKLSANAVFSIVTAAIGGASIVEYFLRFWRLWKKGSTCRVIGARRWYLDWFHWNFSFAWIIIMVELIVGTVPRNPPIRLLSMPLTTMLFVFGTELLVVDTLRLFRVPAPLRISSIPKGAQLRPGIYTLIEDVCAVDGSGGTEFREALNRRYEASHIFRAMLRRLGIFWAVGAEGMAVVSTILIFTINPEAAYTFGWSAAFVWAGVWTLFTIIYVKMQLKKERREWCEEVAIGSSPARGKSHFWSSGSS